MGAFYEQCAWCEKYLRVVKARAGLGNEEAVQGGQYSPALVGNGNKNKNVASCQLTASFVNTVGTYIYHNRYPNNSFMFNTAENMT